MSPNYRKDVIALERGQKRSARMLPGIQVLNYKDRFSLDSRECSRLKSDVMEVYKLKMGRENLLSMVRACNILKGRGKKVKKDLRAIFFHTEGGDYLEQAANGNCGGRYYYSV